MRIDDVWRNLDNKIKVFRKSNFDNVPEKSGVYAWFYPITVFDPDLNELISEINKIFFFDVDSNGLPEREINLNYSWKTLYILLRENENGSRPPNDVYEAWNSIYSDSEKFTELRKILLVSSILLPPLYIGKAKNLKNRCMQHRKGLGGPGKFRGRFEQYAIKQKLSVNYVEDLLFVCVYTDDEKFNDDLSSSFENPRSLVEEILKCAAKPPYGKK